MRHPPESLLHHVWKLKKFDLKNLKTVSGLPITIIKAGIQNDDAGPDFLNAEIKVGNNIWHGHVEMHVRASDWIKHNHQIDQAYRSVILHVVFIADVAINLPNGEPLACLELQHRIDPGILDGCATLHSSTTWIPCQNILKPINPITQRAWYERLLVERLEIKTQRIHEALTDTNGDWEEAFYRLLARNFGFKKNADAFEALAINTPRHILLRHRDKLEHIEALLFGQSGLPPKASNDAYTNRLKQDYQFFERKYHLSPMEGHRWKFLRMRPANFPTIRIAQFAVLFYRTNHLFSKALTARSITEIRNMLTSEVSGFWQTHYTFKEDGSAQSKPKHLGEASLDLICINTIVPLLFYYGIRHGYQEFKQRALNFLEDLKAEKNQILKRFSETGLASDSAFDSQALLQLKSHYCDKRRCLQCAIGNALLTKNQA